MIQQPPFRPSRTLRIPDFPLTHGLIWQATLLLLHAGFALLGILLFALGLHYSWSVGPLVAFGAVVAYCLTIMMWVTLTTWRTGHPRTEGPQTEQFPPFKELPWSPP